MRELIGKCASSPVAAAKAEGGLSVGGGYRPSTGLHGIAAAQARREVAYRSALEVGRLRAEGVLGQAAMARALNQRGVRTPTGTGTSTHTTVARVVPRAVG